MKKIFRSMIILILVFPAFSAFVSRVSAQTFTEWVIPTTNSHPADIIVYEGLVYFIEELGNKIGGFDPLTETFTEWVIPTTNSQPPKMVVYNGLVYFTERLGNKIGRLDPSTGSFTEWTIPTENSEPVGIEVYNGVIYFTEHVGNKIGRFDPSTGAFTEWVVPAAGSWPHDIVVYEGVVYFTEMLGNKIGRLDPSTGSFTEWTIPTENSWPHDITFYLKDGELVICFTQTLASNIGFLKLPSGTWETYHVGSSPWGITASLGLIYYTTSEGNTIGRLDPSSGILTEWVVPTANSGPVGIAVYSNLVYFTELNVNKIGLLSVPPVAPRIESVIINRNPVITTYKGFSLSAPPPLNVAKMTGLGVWVSVKISNPTADVFDGRLRVFFTDPTGRVKEYFTLGDKIRIHLDARSSKTYYVPIYGNWVSGTWNIRLVLGHGLWWYNWKTLDEEVIQLKVETNVPTEGPKHLGIGKPISEFLSAPKPSLSDLAMEFLNFVLLLAQAKGSAYVSPSGPVFKDPGSIKDLLPMPTRTEDPSIISEALSSSTFLRITSLKIGVDTFKLSLRTFATIVWLTIGDKAFAFSPYYDRVRMILKLPQGIDVVKKGDAIEVIKDDEGNTFVIWVDNYPDKLFSAGSAQYHSIEVKLGKRGIFNVEAYAYFEVGPLDKEPRSGVFPIMDYSKWNYSPADVYWIEFTSKAAKIALEKK